MKIQILGSGCDKCQQLAANATKAVEMAGISCDIEKVTDINQITAFGVMMTPALALDGKVLSAGKVLDAHAIAGYIRNATGNADKAAGATAAAPAPGASGDGPACTCADKGAAADAGTPVPAAPLGSCGCGTAAGNGGTCCSGKKFLTTILLAFIIFSVVAMVVRQGKNNRVATDDKTTAAAAAQLATTTDAPLTLYYFHGNTRCKTCNSIEALTREAVNTHFANDIAQGRIVFKVVNFDDDANAHFIKDFELSSSNVVVHYAGQFRRLDAVWELVRQPDQFGPFIAENIKDMLEVKNEQ